VKADQTGFVAELSVPWQMLAQAGLSRDQLMINLNSRGPLPGPPVMRRGFERLIAVPRELAQPKTLSVRLHFAEIEGAEPGQRVFDVKLGGNVVLEAVVKQFQDVVASRAVTLELIPKAKDITELTAPIISGIEILSTEPDK